MTEAIVAKRCVNPNCTIKDVQPLTNFYVRSGYDHPTMPGHYNSECKACLTQRCKDHVPHLPEESRVWTENLAIQQLKAVGIWAQPGKESGAPDVDVTAWGVVWIEVKHARLELHGSAEEFTFVVTPKQAKKGLLADLVLLICEWKPEVYTFHLFRSDDPVFYMDGRLKTGFTYRPGRTKALKHGLNRVVMTEAMMTDAKDRWALIEDVRREHMGSLPSQPFPHRRWRED